MRTFVGFMLVGVLFVWAGPGDSQVVVRNTTVGKALIVSKDAPPGPEVAKIGMNIFDLEATFPLMVRQDEQSQGFTALENTVGFRLQNFSYQWPEGDTEYKPDQVYGLSYGLSLVRSHGQRWRSITFASAGIYSDLEDFGGDDFLAEGGILLVRSLGAHWQLGAGPVFTYAFGNPLLIPAPYVRYQGGGRYLVDMRLPQYAVVLYQLTPRAQLGLALRSLFDNYNLGDPRAEDAAGKSSSIVFSDITLGIESKVQLSELLVLDLGFATTLNRTLEVNDHRGDKSLDRGLEDTWTASVGLSIGPQ